MSLQLLAPAIGLLGFLVAVQALLFGFLPPASSWINPDDYKRLRYTIYMNLAAVYLVATSTVYLSSDFFINIETQGLLATKMAHLALGYFGVGLVFCVVLNTLIARLFLHQLFSKLADLRKVDESR